jgi:rRNA processing protein Krr1/Pno1
MVMRTFTKEQIDEIREIAADWFATLTDENNKLHIDASSKEIDIETHARGYDVNIVVRSREKPIEGVKTRKIVTTYDQLVDFVEDTLAD